MHASISSLVGRRSFALWGCCSAGWLAVVGRHFTMFVTCTDSLLSFMRAKSSLRRSPALPTNGLPSISSFLPGPSPTNMTWALGGPSPGTGLVLVHERGHLVHASISLAILRSSSSELGMLLPCGPAILIEYELKALSSNRHARLLAT